MQKKKKFWSLGFILTVDRAIGHYSAASYFMESSSSTAIIAELETAKSACLEIMSPVVMSAEKLGKENNLLQDKISALELELSNAKAENLALQGRVNELQECNVLIGSTNERISAQVTAHFTEKEDLERKISELSKVLNPETFNNMVAANRMYKSEVCQFRDHCNLLAAQARSPSFLTVLQLQNPPPI